MTAFSSLEGTIAERIHQIRQTLPDSVRLVAVTKQVPIAAMREAYAAGMRDFGESRVQEVEAKQLQLQDLSDITWHLIGHLQSNKVQRALEVFQWIHSIDSLKLAQRLNQLAESLTHKPQVCLQIKLLPDPNKYGWAVPELLNDFSQVAQCKHLDIRGLMTIPPLGLTEAELIQVFQNTRTLSQKLRQAYHADFPHLQLSELSMGMSSDYRLAVQAGATIVRLGRVLFGDRI